MTVLTIVVMVLALVLILIPKRTMLVNRAEDAEIRKEHHILRAKIGEYRQLIAEGMYEAAFEHLLMLEGTGDLQSEIVYARSQVYLAMGDRKNQIIHLQEAIEEDPKNDICLIALGDYYSVDDDYINAIEAYKEAVKNAIKPMTVYDKIGLCYKELRDMDEARKYFKKAINSAIYDEDKSSAQRHLNEIDGQ